MSQTLFLAQEVSDTVFLVSGTLILAQRVSDTQVLRPSIVSKRGRWVAGGGRAGVLPARGEGAVEPRGEGAAADVPRVRVAT